jgi:hypothetical protein
MRKVCVKDYTSTTQFNCGIDLNARQLYVCLMDRDGKKLVHTDIKNNDFDYFLKLLAPYRHDLTACAECMFGWYWLADACQADGLHFGIREDASEAKAYGARHGKRGCPPGRIQVSGVGLHRFSRWPRPAAFSKA